MSGNSLKITFRKLKREKMYALINICGLSLAITCCLILGLYLRSELTYDRHYTGHKQIYRVVNEYNTNGKLDSSALTSHVLGEMLAEEYSDIKESVRMLVLKARKDLFQYEDKNFYWENVTFASDNVFKVFAHNIIYGDPDTALNDPVSVAVSKSFAKTYFGDSNPVGKIIKSENRTHRVTLVFDDLPENTHLKYDVLLSINFWKQTVYYPGDTTARRKDLWESGGLSCYTYVLMPENYNIQNFKDISSSFYQRHMAEEGKASNRTWNCWLQPLASIHYHSDVGDDEPTGNKFYLYGFTAVAIFIMFVACINYMNLATARASRRSKEVGMQKILGSGRGRLILMFIGEAICFCLIAMMLSIILAKVILTLTPVNEIAGKTLVLDLYDKPLLMGWMILFSVVLGLVSGIYPAFYLSSIMPISALVSKTRAGKGSIRLRGVLVLIQFTISVCVIACTLIMTLQMNYVSSKSLGFNKEHRLVITLRGADLIDKVPVIKKDILKDKGILGVAYCSNIIGKTAGLQEARIDNNDNAPELRKISSMTAGDDFIEVMGMEVNKGRDFSKETAKDAGIKYIVNETMVRSMGWDQPLGKVIEIDGANGKVIGVVKDFHYASLKSKIEPFALQQFTGISVAEPNLRQYVNGFLVVKIDGNEISRTIDLLKDEFNEFDPGHPFEFEFLDASLNELYQSEDRLMKMIGIFAAVCIFISCMGLFGLVAFSTEQRSREIAIRKVLGASTWQIIIMLAKNIQLIILGGAVIASLAAYYFMEDWLAGFSYRIHPGLGVFLVSAFTAAVVAFITVILQSLKTAQANPVETLRND